MIRILKLTKENYYSKEANLEYMSNSLYKSIVECPAKAMASLHGEIEEEDKTAFIMGNLLHSWSESKEAFEQFKDNHPEIYTRKGTLRKSPNYAIIDDWIRILKDDKKAMFSLRGEKEVICTGELFGVNWKIRIDALDHGKKAFTDLKTTREINKRYWDNKAKEWVNFIQHWGYDKQLSIYAEILRDYLGIKEYYTPHILAVSKEKKAPDKELIYISKDDIPSILEKIELGIGDDLTIYDVLDIWKGRKEAKSCGHCSYCKSRKQIEKAVYYMDIGI